jgi:hypothetical protein
VENRDCCDAPIHQFAPPLITLLEDMAMNSKTYGSQLETRTNADAHTNRRAQLIKKARESVQASHQRMHSRLRKTRV